MGFWKTSEKLALGTTKLAGKAAAKTTVLAYTGTKTATKIIYRNRKTIGGTAYGTTKGTIDAIHDASGNLISGKSINSKIKILAEQSARYRALTSQFKERLNTGDQYKNLLLDTLIVGGTTLSEYITSSEIPNEIQRAYELAYPNVASLHGFSDQLDRLDRHELVGFISGIKGKLFELQYVDYLNQGILPDGFHAELANSPTNPGWDIAIMGPDNAINDTIQAKATDSVSYVTKALEENPQIDVVTTSEVHSHLMMQGFSESVIDGGISNSELATTIDSALDGADISMDWMPSAVSLALIAFSAYNQEGLSAYQKGCQFGERSIKSYLAYLAGGCLAVAANTWWAGVLGSMGSRLMLGAGRQKRMRLRQLKELIKNNKRILKQFERQLSCNTRSPFYFFHNNRGQTYTID